MARPAISGITIKTAREASAGHGIKCLVYGRSGIGKTRLCATAPRPVIISAEAGMLSLRDSDVAVIEISKLDDLNRAHDMLVGPTGAAFSTICIDSLSEIGEKVLSNAKAGTKDGRQAYGTLADQMWATIRAFRDIKGKHVVMTAKAEWVKDEHSGITRWAPSMPGRQLTQGLPYFFDEVFYYGSFKGGESGEFKALQTGVDLQYEAKDRSGALLHYEFPDLSAIFSKIQGA